jgi:hypothetical protein
MDDVSELVVVVGDDLHVEIEGTPDDPSITRQRRKQAENERQATVVPVVAMPIDPEQMVAEPDPIGVHDVHSLIVDRLPEVRHARLAFEGVEVHGRVGT